MVINCGEVMTRCSTVSITESAYCLLTSKLMMFVYGIYVVMILMWVAKKINKRKEAGK